MRILRYTVLVLIAVALLIVASANREAVLLTLLPKELTTYIGWNWAVRLPLFLVILGALAAGVLLGFVWEWLREHKHRAKAARKSREANQLSREVAKLKPNAEDDVLAILKGSEKKAG